MSGPPEHQSHPHSSWGQPWLNFHDGQHLPSAPDLRNISAKTISTATVHAVRAFNTHVLATVMSTKVEVEKAVEKARVGVREHLEDLKLAVNAENERKHEFERLMSGFFLETQSADRDRTRDIGDLSAKLRAIALGPHPPYDKHGELKKLKEALMAYFVQRMVLAVADKHVVLFRIVDIEPTPFVEEARSKLNKSLNAFAAEVVKKRLEVVQNTVDKMDIDTLTDDGMSAAKATIEQALEHVDRHYHKGLEFAVSCSNLKGDLTRLGAIFDKRFHPEGGHGQASG